MHPIQQMPGLNTQSRNHAISVAQVRSNIRLGNPKRRSEEMQSSPWRWNGRPEAIVTDRLRSYGAALRDIGAPHRQGTGRWSNNRSENSHLSFRRREQAMLLFRMMRSLQKFTSVYPSVYNVFNAERSVTSRSHFKLNRAAALTEWRSICPEQSAPFSIS